MIGGVLLSLNLEHILQLHRSASLGVQLMPADVYYITGLPTDLQVSDVVHDRGWSPWRWLPRDDLSGLARGAHGPGGGAAL